MKLLSEAYVIFDTTNGEVWGATELIYSLEQVGFGSEAITGIKAMEENKTLKSYEIEIDENQTFVIRRKSDLDRERAEEIAERNRKSAA